MILPITAYGSPVLRTACAPVAPGLAGLHALIDNMWETLYNADGVGLAAPQVGVALRLFLVDSADALAALSNEERAPFPDDEGIRQVFINAQILSYSREQWTDVEGCLSIPGIAEEVRRPVSITIRYQDEHLAEHERTFCGHTARMIQHEYGHTEGRLYLDYLRPLKQTLLQNRLRCIAAGRVRPPYPMAFA